MKRKKTKAWMCEEHTKGQKKALLRATHILPKAISNCGRDVHVVLIWVMYLGDSGREGVAANNGEHS